MNAIPLNSKKTNTVASITSIFAHMDADKSLVLKTKAGDEKAFETLFRKYYLRLCHYAYQYTGNMPDAEELVQDAFVKVWERKSSLEIDRSFKSYIYMAVKNNGLNAIRGEKRRQSHHQIQSETIPEQQQPEDTVYVDEIKEQLFDGLEALPPKCRTIFQMSRIEGLKHKEIAARLEIKVKTVENQIGIALKFLRKHLSDYLQILALIFSTSNF